MNKSSFVRGFCGGVQRWLGGVWLTLRFVYLVVCYIARRRLYI